MQPALSVAISKLFPQVSTARIKAATSQWTIPLNGFFLIPLIFYISELEIARWSRIILTLPAISMEQTLTGKRDWTPNQFYSNEFNNAIY